MFWTGFFLDVLLRKFTGISSLHCSLNINIQCKGMLTGTSLWGDSTVLSTECSVHFSSNQPKLISCYNATMLTQPLQQKHSKVNHSKIKVCPMYSVQYILVHNNFSCIWFHSVIQFKYSFYIFINHRCENLKSYK